MINVHYHPITGSIMAWDNSRLPRAIPDCAITQVVHGIHAIDLAAHKIDPAT
jgi:hypothetical protein